jgi:hypothetical protein
MTTELCSELKRSIDSNGMLMHPLVLSIVVHESLHQHFNEQLALKKMLRDQAFADCDWNTYVFLHERPFRMQALCDVLSLLNFSNADDASLILSIWADSESPHVNADIWRKIFKQLDREAAMQAEDFARLQAMPEKFVVYRGVGSMTRKGVALYSAATIAKGLSWSLSRDIASWYATRFTETGRVVEATVRRDHCLLLSHRGEEEIISIIRPTQFKTLEDITS